MNRSMPIAALLAALALAACDRPVVVNTPPATVAVPGPAGPPGATGRRDSPGAPGYDGSKSKPGTPGIGTTVIVTPLAASTPTNRVAIPHGAAAGAPGPAARPGSSAPQLGAGGVRTLCKRSESSRLLPRGLWCLWG